MKALQKAVLLVAAILVCIACNKSTSPTEEVDYYVKYSISDGSSGKVTYKIENGAATTVDGVSFTGFERTIGPVKKGFEASITVTPAINPTSYYKPTANGRIEIKKGDAPFVVKKEGVINYGLTYKIDF